MTESPITTVDATTEAPERGVLVATRVASRADLPTSGRAILEEGP